MHFFAWFFPYPTPSSPLPTSEKSPESRALTFPSKVSFLFNRDDLNETVSSISIEWYEILSDDI